MITLLTVGTTKDKNIAALTQEYLKRLSSEKIILKTVKEEKAKNPEEIKQKEGKRILEVLDSNSYVIALVEEGKLINSIAFADFLKKSTDKNIVFVVGGAFGLSFEVKKRANLLLSLSPMTFPHEIAHLLLVEQLYRAWTINRGHQYHK